MLNYKMIASFFIGGAISSFTTYLIVKNKYKKELKELSEDFQKTFFTEAEKFKEKIKNDFDNSKRILNTNSESEVKKILHHYNEEDTEDNQKDGDLKSDRDKMEQIIKDEFNGEFDYDTIVYGFEKGNKKNGNLKIEETDNSDFNEYVEKVSSYNPNDIRPTTEEIKQITEDEFGEEFDYDTITLYYYSDGILADSNDNIIDNANTILVPNFENRFENDVLFIRNHRLQSDFEILKMSNKTYSEISE